LILAFKELMKRSVRLQGGWVWDLDH